MRTETKSRILFTVLTAPLWVLVLYWYSVGVQLWATLVLVGAVAVLAWVWWPKKEAGNEHSAQHASGHETKK
jgi:hypothetical protein